jgi:hypothetical protein
MFYSLKFDIFAKMSGFQEINMSNLHESKLDAVLKAIEALTAKIGALENLASGIGTTRNGNSSTNTTYSS